MKGRYVGLLLWLPILAIASPDFEPRFVRYAEPEQRGLAQMLDFIAQESGQRLSAGCIRQAPSAPPRTITVDGRNREVLVVVPDHYQPMQPQRLVFGFHGRTNSNRQARAYFGLEAAALPDTIFVYPAGIRHGSSYSWFRPQDRADRLRDYQFFDALLATLSNQYCVDQDEVYVAAHSLGASFANSLACARGDRIRAAATLAGGISPSNCSGRVAAMVLHNPMDRLVDFAHGLRVRDHFLDQNGIEGDPRPSGPSQYHCQRYGGTTNPVIWCPHRHDYGSRGTFYPHNWPRSMGKLVMDFFQSLP